MEPVLGAWVPQIYSLLIQGFYSIKITNVLILLLHVYVLDCSINKVFIRFYYMEFAVWISVLSFAH